jgi:hypothetical protein
MYVPTNLQNVFFHHYRNDVDDITLTGLVKQETTNISEPLVRKTHLYPTVQDKFYESSGHCHVSQNFSVLVVGDC